MSRRWKLNVAETELNNVAKDLWVAGHYIDKVVISPKFFSRLGPEKHIPDGKQRVWIYSCDFADIQIEISTKLGPTTLLVYARNTPRFRLPRLSVKIKRIRAHMKKNKLGPWSEK